MALKRSFRLALITGASSGLGQELAQQLQRCGLEVIESARAHCDLTGSLEPLKAVIRERAPDLIINNAGYTIYGHCLDELDEQPGILRVNATAPIELTLEAARILKERGLTGTILNISSAAALFPFPAMAAYAAAKACLASFSKSFDLEMRPFGIRVLVSLPGQIATPFAARAAKNPRLSLQTFSMSTKQAATLILRQIERQTPVSIIDWRTRWLVYTTRFLPDRWIAQFLERQLLKRI